MQFIIMITMIFMIVFSAFDTIVAVDVSYDPLYDETSVSVDAVACAAQLRKDGYTTLGSIDAWPWIGGSSMVSGPNSPNCGTCWKLTWAQNHKIIWVVAVDSDGEGFNLSEWAMDLWTDGQAVKLGRITDVTMEQVDLPPSLCGHVL